MLVISMVTPLCSHCSHCSVLESPHREPMSNRSVCKDGISRGQGANLSAKRGVSMASTGAPLPRASARKFKAGVSTDHLIGAAAEAGAWPLKGPRKCPHYFLCHGKPERETSMYSIECDFSRDMVTCNTQ
jgi:hypothetical protein